MYQKVPDLVRSVQMRSVLAFLQMSILSQYIFYMVNACCYNKSNSGFIFGKFKFIRSKKSNEAQHFFFSNTGTFPKIWGHPAHTAQALLTQHFYPPDESNPRAKQIKNIHSFNCFIQPAQSAIIRIGVQMSFKQPMHLHFESNYLCQVGQGVRQLNGQRVVL